MSENLQISVNPFRTHSGANTESLIQGALDDGLLTVQSLDDALEQFERTYLVRLLQRTDGNVAKAAKLAKRHRTDLYKLLKRHRVNRESFKVHN